MSVTIKDIARQLGVSTMTVSRVLNNSAGMSEATRERVLAKLAELNYQPNIVARSLVTRRTHTIGVVVPDLMHSFFAEVVSGIESVTSKCGYHLLICNSGEQAQKELSDLRLLQQRQVDGVILASTLPTKQTRLLQSFLQAGMNLVLIDRDHPDLNCHRLITNDEQIGRIATEHLIKLGHRRIGHLTGPLVSVVSGRVRGYRQALQANGLPVNSDWIKRCGFSQGDSYLGMKQLLAEKPRVTAVFAVNDPTAIGAMKAIYEAGLSVPHDVALIGAGNILNADMLRVPLTTVLWATVELGRIAAQLILEQIDGSKPFKPQRIVFEPRLIIRNSDGSVGVST